MVKTALKLLLVFVEYSESNAPLFIYAVNSVASTTGQKPSLPPPPLRAFSYLSPHDGSPFCVAGALPWANLVSILEEKNGADPELLVYTVTLINKVCVEGEPNARYEPLRLLPQAPMSLSLALLSPPSRRWQRSQIRTPSTT